MPAAPPLSRGGPDGVGVAVGPARVGVAVGVADDVAVAVVGAVPVGEGELAPGVVVPLPAVAVVVALPGRSVGVAPTAPVVFDAPATLGGEAVLVTIGVPRLTIPVPLPCASCAASTWL